MPIQQPPDEEPKPNKDYSDPDPKVFQVDHDLTIKNSILVVNSDGVRVVSTVTHNTIFESSWGTLIAVLGCLGAMVALFLVWGRRVAALDKERTGWDYLTSGSDSLLKILIVLFAASSLLNLWLAVSNFKGSTSIKYAFGLCLLAILGLIVAQFIITDSKSRTLATSSFKLQFGYFFSVVTLVIQAIGVAYHLLKRKKE